MRAVFARLLLALVLVAWVGGQLAASVHQLKTVHLRCIEHGHLVEQGIAAADPAPDGDGQVQIHQAAPCQTHGSHCPLHVIPGIEKLPVLQVAATPVARPLPPLASRPDAPPRGPPLAYAPKTSPPTSC